MKKCLLYLLLSSVLQFLSPAKGFAQLDSIFDQNNFRTFIVHLPAGYLPTNQYPLVINLHGLNSNAAQQEAYSQFNNVADTAGFIVVYPNALGGSWSLFNAQDVNFISHLIDTIRANYSCNSCLFATGISQGGFMTYKLTCELPQPLTAVAGVACNMIYATQLFCLTSAEIPVMHFHGTADAIVSYNGAFGITPVDTTLRWFVNRNNCNPVPAVVQIPDTSTSDNCHVEKQHFTGGNNGSEVIFYKIFNGGHTWPGAVPIWLLGNTNQDINASSLIGNFFQVFCLNANSVPEEIDVSKISAFPNPGADLITIQLPDENFNLSVRDQLGRNVCLQKNARGATQIDCTNFPNGIYYVQAYNGISTFSQKIIVNH